MKVPEAAEAEEPNHYHTDGNQKHKHRAAATRARLDPHAQKPECFLLKYAA